mgnify:CR=1 FL=1
MRSFILLFLIVCFTSQLQAQFMPTANLTIFSEDGNKFFLILNGERQNDVAQTNIRLEELPQPYYTVPFLQDNCLQNPSFPFLRK